MRLLKIVMLLIFISLSPLIALAHGHGGHGHGGHGHGGGHHSGGHHGGGYHGGGHSYHRGGGHYSAQRSAGYYRPHYGEHRYSHGPRYGNRTWFWGPHVHVGGGGGQVPNYSMQGRQELAGGIGALTAQQLFDNKVAYASPGFSLTYRYFVSPRVAIGITGGIQTVHGNDLDNTYYQPQAFNFDITNLTLALDLKWLYLSEQDVQLYGGASAGVRHYTEHDQYMDGTTAQYSGNRFDGQFTALGIRVGRTLGVFAEMGIGYKGLICGGISYQPNIWHPHRAFVAEGSWRQ